MAIVAIDVNKLIRQYLTVTTTELYALVGTRVNPLRKHPDWTVAQACLVFSIRGGDTDRDVPIKRPNVQFMCYGGTDQVQDSMAVARALEDRLHGVVMQAVSEGVLMEAEQDAEPQPLVDPDTEEIYVFCAYEIECRGA